MFYTMAVLFYNQLLMSDAVLVCVCVSVCLCVYNADERRLST